MKIFFVHGIGHADLDQNYYVQWETDLTAQLRSCNLQTAPQYEGLTYDPLFQQYDHGPATYAAALVEFLGSAAVHSVTDPLTAAPPGTRGFFDLFDSLRWQAGMVAQLAVESALRKALRDKLVAALNEFQPDILAAHSLGTLITYDLFRNDPRGRDILTNGVYITFGSQINNPFARSRLFPGQIQVPNVRFWYHLFNPQDPVLTAPIQISDRKFLQVPTPSPSGHSPTATNTGPGYLDHPNTKSAVWIALARPPSARAFARSLTIFSRATEKPKRRALLIGINDYPDPANQLDGCVNDTFLMSSLLQERGFDPEDIRVVLNDRATADAIRDRLNWLLEGAKDGMERVLFYSGHGAQLPLYNAVGEIDHKDECLVPYDFAWTKESAITDDDFYHLYSDLPFSAHFFAVFDCCHSGGITRDGSRKVRGLTPPDDIRHRMLRWNGGEQMWEERDWKDEDLINDNYGGTADERAEMMGRQGVTYRIGRGMRLRECLSKTESARLVKQKRALYLPVLLEACGEEELSYEYRHGTISYGAFTYSMAKNLRANPASTFQALITRTIETLRALRYDQRPQIVGPDEVLRTRVPGSIAQAGKKKNRR